MAEWARRIEALSGPYHPPGLLPAGPVRGAGLVRHGRPGTHARSWAYQTRSRRVLRRAVRHQPGRVQAVPLMLALTWGRRAAWLAAGAARRLPERARPGRHWPAYRAVAAATAPLPDAVPPMLTLLAYALIATFMASSPKRLSALTALVVPVVFNGRRLRRRHRADDARRRGKDRADGRDADVRHPLPSLRSTRGRSTRWWRGWCGWWAATRCGSRWGSWCWRCWCRSTAMPDDLPDHYGGAPPLYWRLPGMSRLMLAGIVMLAGGVMNIPP